MMDAKNPLWYDQFGLDQERREVGYSAKQLWNRCRFLSERIVRYYGTMKVEWKINAMRQQKAQLYGMMDHLKDFMDYWENEEAWAEIDNMPLTAEALAQKQLDAITQNLLKDEMNDLLRKL